MDAYQKFAEIYDEAMQEIPYDSWTEDVINCLKEHGITEGTVCELGCGTGLLTRRFAAAGFEMTGIDLSEDMLSIAMQKELEEQSDSEERVGIQYVCMDMCEFALPQKADAIVSLCDSMNYLLTEDELFMAFQCVKENLKKDGIFIFDMKSTYCYEIIMGDETRVEELDEGVLIWENTFFKEDAINQYGLTIFSKEPDSDLYRRTEEFHEQRAYEVSDVQKLLGKAGLKLVATYGNRIGEPVKKESERFYFVVKQESETD